MKRIFLLFSLAFLGVLFALPARAVTLRYALKKGAEITYKVQVAAASRMSGPGGDKMGMNSTIESIYRIKVLNILPSGEMEIEKAAIGGKVKMTAEGKDHESDMPKGKSLFKLSPLGKITALPKKETKDAATPSEAENGDSEEANQPSLEMSGLGLVGANAQMDMLTDATFLPLPEKEVKAGDTWEFEISSAGMALPMPANKTAEKPKVKGKSELVELLDYKGRKCAHIKTRYELAISSDRSDAEMGIKVTVNGKVAGTIDWYFDYENSCTPSATSSLQMLMKMTTELPPEMAEELPAEMSGENVMSMKANAKTSLEK